MGMARDDYFPTAVGTFEFDIKKSHLQDRRGIDTAEKKREGNGRDDGSRKEPETMSIPMMSASAHTGGGPEAEKVQKVGRLTLRLMGYITDERLENQQKRRQQEEEEEEDVDDDEDAPGDDEDDDGEGADAESEEDE